MVCGGPVVVGICLMGFCGGLVVVDGHGMSCMVFFFFGVCDLVLGLFLFVILVLGVVVMDGGGCGSGFGWWWVVVVGGWW